MAVLRDRPYVQFNFLVDLGTGNTDGPEAGFQEVSGIGMEVTVSEYRNGNEKENSVRKITGLNKASDVTLKRGVIGSLNLYQWLDQIRNGDQKALRTVTIQLQSEDHTTVVQTWKLIRARIIKHTSGPFNAKGTDVAAAKGAARQGESITVVGRIGGSEERGPAEWFTDVFAFARREGLRLMPTAMHPQTQMTFKFDNKI